MAAITAEKMKQELALHTETQNIEEWKLKNLLIAITVELETQQEVWLDLLYMSTMHQCHVNPERKICTIIIKWSKICECIRGLYRDSICSNIEFSYCECGPYGSL